MINSQSLFYSNFLKNICYNEKFMKKFTIYQCNQILDIMKNDFDIIINEVFKND